MRERAGTTWIPWAIGALALVVSVVGIGEPGLWFDEVATLAASSRSWPALGAMLTDVDAVHALYYATMHLWLDAVGYTPALLRLPSALAVAGTAVVVAQLGRFQWGTAAGALAGLSFVVVPRTVWMAIEARSFAVATFFLTLAVHLLVRALAGGRTRHWVGYAAALALASTYFFYCFLALPAIVLGAAWQCRGRRRDVLRLIVATALGAAPALPVALAAVTQRGQVAWIEKVGPSDVVALPRVFLGGFLGNIFTPPGIVASSVALALSIALAAWLYVARLRRDRDAGAPPPIAPGPMSVIVLGWMALPALELLAAGAILPLYDPKYCAISTPALALLFGAGLSAVRDWRPFVAGALLVGLGAQYWVAIRRPDAKGPILATARAVAGVAEPGDGLWVEHDSLARVAAYAYPDAFRGLRDLTIDRNLEHSGTLWETEIPLADAGPRLAGVDRVVGLTRQPGDPAAEIAALEDRGFRPVSASDHGDYRVWVFERLV